MLTPHEPERNLPAPSQAGLPMEWRQVRRGAVFAGIAAGELVVFGNLLAESWLIGDALSIIFTATVVGGGIGAAVAAILNAKRGKRQTINRLEDDLHHLTQLMERRLINEQEYLNLKAKVVGDFQPGLPARPGLMRRLTFWSALTGFTLTQFGFAISAVPYPELLLLATVAGVATGALVGAAGSFGMQRLRLRLAQPALNAPPDRVMIDDPVLRDRPALEG